MSAASQIDGGAAAPRARESALPRKAGREFIAGSPAAIVFSGAPPSWSAVVVSSGAASFAVYVMLGLALFRGQQLWRAPVARVAPPLVVELIEPAPPPPAPEPPPPAPEPPVARAAPAPRAVEKAPEPPAPAPEPARDTPPPPAEAGQVVAVEPDAPADFTSFDIASGKGARYRGGVTAASGTNTNAVHSALVDRSAAPGSGAGPASLAQPVRLEARDWFCAWPEAAELLAVEEERVLLRVDVDVQGNVTAAHVLSDPGFGFGAAALRCARQHRFLPATDAAGRSIAATSPPIRVRFSR